MNRLITTAVFGALALGLAAQEARLPEWFPKINGTIRTKYELQTEEMEQRFEVRNARVAFSGEAMRGVSYKAEVDFCDEGSLKVLDVFGEVDAFAFIHQRPRGNLSFRLGQFRVPFSLEPHRSPHVRFFANRSFLAKQVGNVRDVGFMGSYELPFGESRKGKFSLRAGLFNGSGLTGQKNYWTKGVNYSTRAELELPIGLSLTASTQKIHPACGNVYLWDASATYRQGPLHLEAEYMHKTYADNKFDDVDALHLLAMYDVPLAGARPGSKAMFERMSFRARYDYMGDHADGNILDATTGKAKLTDVERGRITGGLNFRFARALSKKTITELRLNYEKYLYSDAAILKAKPSERDKLVLELMVRF